MPTAATPEIGLRANVDFLFECGNTAILPSRVARRG